MNMLSYKKISRRLTYVLSGVLVLTGILLGLAGTEAALQWGASRLERISEGRLVLRGAQGSLYGPLSIAEISYQTADKHVELQQVRLDWSPLALLRRHIEVTQLSLKELRLTETQASAEPISLPNTLQLPVNVSIPAHIERVVLKTASREDVLSDLDLYINNFGSYQLTLHRVTTPWGIGTADLKLGNSAPFPITGQVHLQQMREVAYAVDMDISGSLEQLLIKAKAKIATGEAQIDARIAPFLPMPLVEANATLENIDPAVLDKDIPAARFDGAIDMSSRDGGEQLHGNLSLRNSLPGPWDSGHLPLQQVAMEFAGTPAELKFSALRIDLNNAGRFTGEGQLVQGKLELALKTRAFDPHGLHTKIHSMRLAGGIHLQSSAGSQQVRADLHNPRFELHVDAQHENDVVTLKEAAIRSGSGSMRLHGTLGLDGVQPVQLAGELQGLNPAEFGEYPVARINASFSGNGQLSPEPQAIFAFAVADSQFRHAPLSGQGNLRISRERIWESAVSLHLSHNRLDLKGALGQPGDRLDFDLDLAYPSLLDPQLAGQIHAHGSLEGRFAAPAGQIDVQANNLSLGKQHRISDLHAKARIGQGLDGPLEVNVRLRGLATPQFNLDHASVNAQGTRDRHTLNLLFKNDDLDVDAQLAGSWHDASGWTGQVRHLSNRGRHVLALKAPARLELGKQHVLLNDAQFEFVGADFLLNEFVFDAGQLSTRGVFTGLPLAYLLDFLDANEIRTDLTIGGNWNFKAHKSVEGHLALFREHGDVITPTVPQMALGLKQVALKFTAANSRLQAELQATGTRLGRLSAEGDAMLSRTEVGWGLAKDAPLHGNADFAIESLAWMQPLLAPTGVLVFDGAAKASFDVSGKPSQPMLAGTISGERFRVELPEQGLRLKDGRFEAELHNQVLQLNTLTFRGGEGNLTGQGQLALEGDEPTMQVSLNADKLELFSRPDRHLVLSGKGDAKVSGRKVDISARLKADRGLIELPKGDAPTLSDDVVVLGRAEPVKKKSNPYRVSFGLNVDLGESFFLRGKGLDAQLGGAVELTGVPDALPVSRGSLHVVKGAYSAYGQRLEIDRGILNFQGPVDNPGLNIIALRKNQPVEAGVAVTGTALSPQVQLVSEPNVPNAEKLSWLVLGHGLEDSSSHEFSALQAAAGALLAAGESVTLQQRIAHAAGLEEISLKGASGLEGSVLALGKRLSSRAYLSYEQGLDGAGTLVKINYMLNKKLSVRAQAGDVPALDLFYTFSFD